MTKNTHSGESRLESVLPIPDLVNRALSGGEEELAQLLSDERVKAIITGLCRLQCSRDSRNKVNFEDLLDFHGDVVLKILKSLPKLKEISHTKQFSKWVFKVVRSVYIDRIRGRKPEIVDEPFDGYINTIPSQDLDPEAQYMDREVNGNIEMFIDSLPRELKTVVYWKLVDDLSNREVAVKLGRSHPYVAKQLCYVRELLEACPSFQQFKLSRKRMRTAKSRCLSCAVKE